jgi:hypothetical protein
MGRDTVVAQSEISIFHVATFSAASCGVRQLAAAVLASSPAAYATKNSGSKLPHSTTPSADHWLRSRFDGL